MKCLMDVKSGFILTTSEIFASLWSLPHCDCRILISSHIEAKIERGEFKCDKVQKERKPLMPSIHHSIVIALRLSYIFPLFLTSVKGSAITHRIQSCQKCQNLHQRDMESTNVTVCVYKVIPQGPCFRSLHFLMSKGRMCIFMQPMSWLMGS